MEWVTWLNTIVGIIGIIVGIIGCKNLSMAIKINNTIKADNGQLYIMQIQLIKVLARIQCD